MIRAAMFVFLFLMRTTLFAHQADVIVFSYDRPIQLYAFLESLYAYTKGIGETSVVYRSSNQEFSSAYEVVKSTFPDVCFIEQKEPPHDFKPLFLQTLYKEGSSEYIVFAVDDIIVKDDIDLEICTEMMEIHNAYGFYLRLGHNIVDCFSHGTIQSIPPMEKVGDQIYLWQFKRGIGDWAYPNTVDLTVYRKKDIEAAFRALPYYNPNHLEGSFGEANLELFGLCYEKSKMLNLPLNIVSETTSTQQMHITSNFLLSKFKQGLKFDISQFHQIENNSTHSYIYQPTYIPR